MGSPLSGVLACLFLETLEAGPFRQILPTNSTYFRYIDDALIIYPRRTNLETLTAKLNQVEDTIEFTHEKEVDQKLPFLDILFERTDTGLLRKVYRKPSNKDDLINYFSNHSDKINTYLQSVPSLRRRKIHRRSFSKTQISQNCHPEGQNQGKENCKPKAEEG